MSLFALRLSIGAVFIVAGMMKFAMWSTPPEGMPAAMVMLMKFLSIAEPVGGVALILGVLTYWASLCLAIIMVGAVLIVKFVMGLGFFTAQGPGWCWPLVILAACLVLMAVGGGEWSVDSKMRAKKK